MSNWHDFGDDYERIMLDLDRVTCVRYYSRQPAEDAVQVTLDDGTHYEFRRGRSFYDELYDALTDE